MAEILPGMSSYDSWASVYDAWGEGMPNDVEHYTRLAREAEGPIVELAVGTGRVAIPLVRATGKPAIGIDSSKGMLALARERSAGLPLDLRHGDMRDFELDELAALIYVPGRSLLHLRGWREKREVFERAACNLRPGGRFAFNAFVFDHAFAVKLDGQTLDNNGVVHTIAYAPGDSRVDIAREGADTLHLWWATKEEWDGLLDVAGLEIESLYGGFAKEPFTDDSREFVYVARKP